MGKKTIVLFCGIIFAVLILEMGVRFGGMVFTALQNRNTIGYKDDKDVFRILCVGESMTGIGGRKSYPAQLEDILNQRSAGARVKVFNKGVIGTNSSYIVNHLEEYIALCKPRMVIAMTGINDAYIKYYEDIPGSGSGFFNKIRAFRIMKILIKEAGERLKIAACLYFGDSGDCCQMGWSFYAQNRIAQAEALFKKSLLLNSKDDRTYCGLGHIYWMNDDFGRAEEFLKKAVRINPENAKAYSGLGFTYRDTNRRQEAERAFLSSLAIDPQDYIVIFWLGKTFFEQGKFSPAEECWRKSIILDPRRDDGYVALAELYMFCGKRPEAVAVLEQAIAALPERTGTVFGILARLYAEEGNKDLARQYYDKARQASEKEGNAVTVASYLAIKKITDRHHLKLVCVQYPMRPIACVKKIFRDDRSGVIFIDNEKMFKEAVVNKGFRQYFVDMFGGDFGHCSAEGNRLLAQNIADGILRGAALNLSQ